uniref:PPIase cyclophilin-type domain-containing protein n=1 Tax=Clastoptera arizonana TaxID=38151 RepID=A0A1B6DD77_9HEMI
MDNLLKMKYILACGSPEEVLWLWLMQAKMIMDLSFFFTMAATPELQNKHTIFAKVTGETIYNMIKLEECLVDSEDRPLYPPKVLKAEILNNPFSDIVIRVLPKNEPLKEEKKKSKSAGVKNYKLLSFGEEAEEEDEEAAVAAKQYSGRSKSTHDLLLDPKLSSTPAVDTEEPIGDEESSKDSVEARERIDRIKNKLKLSQFKKNTVEDDASKNKQKESDEEEYDFGKERREESKRKIEEMKQEFKSLKKDLKQNNKRKLEEENLKNEAIKLKEKKDENDKFKEDYKKELENYKSKMETIPKKGTSREEHTLALLKKFKNKLSSVKEKEPEAEIKDEQKDLEDESWLAHKLHFEDNSPVLAKDASTKDDDWFEITDPRNAINKRRREASKQLLKNIEKRMRD